jgi:hypothetical protein
MPFIEDARDTAARCAALAEVQAFEKENFPAFRRLLPNRSTTDRADELFADHGPDCHREDLPVEI